MSEEELATAEATTLILPDGTGITEVQNCPYCGGFHAHGRIYGETGKRFPGCCDKSYYVKVLSEKDSGWVEKNGKWVKTEE